MGGVDYQALEVDYPSLVGGELKLRSNVTKLYYCLENVVIRHGHILLLPHFLSYISGFFSFVSMYGCCRGLFRAVSQQKLSCCAGRYAK